MTHQLEACILEEDLSNMKPYTILVKYFKRKRTRVATVAHKSSENARKCAFNRFSPKSTKL